jgi:hypothetical protein
VAETSSLLNCRTRKGTAGSNPALSASIDKKISPYGASVRGVAQPGSASGLGPEGRRFESCLPDIKIKQLLVFSLQPRLSAEL